MSPLRGGAWAGGDYPYPVPILPMSCPVLACLSGLSPDYYNAQSCARVDVSVTYLLPVYGRKRLDRQARVCLDRGTTEEKDRQLGQILHTKRAARETLGHLPLSS